MNWNSKLYMPSTYAYFGLVNSPYSAVWETDGSSANTKPTAYVDGASFLTPISAGKFAFVTADPAYPISFPLVLYVSDGTQAGTERIKSFYSISPAALGAIYQMNSCNGKLFFWVNDIINGTLELWTSDGTLGGTAMLKGFSTSTSSHLNKDQPISFSYNNELYFGAIGVGATTGIELWKSDGTAAGTVLVKDINPGYNQGSVPIDFFEFNGQLYFSADDGSTSGREIWKTDGTSTGTVIFKDLYPGFADSDPKGFAIKGSEFFFSARGENIGVELWKSDGTAGNTVMIKDINPGGTNSNPAFLTVFNNELYFFANDGTNGSEIWKSDGTETGTMLLKDVKPGATGQSIVPHSMKANSNFLFFIADDGTHGEEVWKTDGTTANTQLLEDIQPGSASGVYNSSTSDLAELYLINDKIVFSANDNLHGFEPWVTDGNSTHLLRDTNPASTNIEDYIVSQLFPDFGGDVPDNRWFADGSYILFEGNDPTAGTEPYISNGTSGGTTLLKDIYPGSNGSSPESYFSSNGLIYFSAADATGTNLWVSDGTAANTSKVGSGLNPSHFIEYQGNVYFYSTAGLYKTDGTTPGTSLIFSGSMSKNGKPLIFNSLLYFVGNGSSSGEELWVTDGDPTLSAAHTHLVKDIVSGSGSSSPYNLYAFNGSIFFVADDGTHGQELWKTNGTDAGTVMVQDLNTTSNNNGDSKPYGLTEVSGELFFAADDGLGVAGFFGSFHLFKTDGNTISLVKRLSTTGDPAPFGFTAYNSKLYFTAKDGVHGYELWVSDGSTGGTVMVEDLLPGETSSAPFGLIVHDNKLFFAANDQTYGYEPRYVDTGGTIQLLQDIKTGGAGSLSLPFVKRGADLFFWASGNDDQIHLYKLGGNCPETLSPNGVITMAQKANLSITTGTSNTIQNGAKVLYQAGNFVTLNPGFVSENGSVFLTKLLEGCQ